MLIYDRATHPLRDAMAQLSLLMGRESLPLVTNVIRTSCEGKSGKKVGQ